MDHQILPGQEAAPRSVEALISAVAQGFRPKYLFFYSHRALPGGKTGRTCLSQWWPSGFEVDNYQYASAEHFMMAEKARLFGDEDILAEILKAPHPAEAKKLGRQVKGYDEQVWEKHRFDIVVRGNVAKFSQSKPLEDFLLGTFDQHLVEASPTDRYGGLAWRRAIRGRSVLKRGKGSICWASR